MSNNEKISQALFLTAAAIESEEDRAAFLDQACGDDKGLRQQVEQLLLTTEKNNSLRNSDSARFDPTIVPESSPDVGAAASHAELESASGLGESIAVGNGSQSVLQSLSHTVNVPRVLLKDADEDEPMAQPHSPEVPNADADSRYQLLGEIARGGMGAILKGRDTDLGRDLAIKVLLDSHKDKPEVIQRFIEEAQIGGQLQHPGIAPIYELGQFADQRPFFSMKLVKGDTLAKLLADREDASVDRGKLLGIFEQICQTMAYAHSRGVIHRDLKPANIMVGAFGEVQVMDWGLAKVLSFGGVADEKAAKLKQHDVSIIQTMRSVGSEIPSSIDSIGSNGTETQMGSVMGTPAYMPPEQALGEIDQLNQRSDVFGLGAILCEILTGQPPYVAEDGTHVFRLASRGKLEDAFARLDSCGADSELLTLTRHCLELEPADRPKDGGALAKRISGYLEAVETKLRDTELAKVDAQARTEEIGRRQKQGILAGAAIAATLLIGIAVSGWQAVRATSAETQATNAAQKANEEAARAIAAEEETKDTLVQVAAERDAKDKARQDAEAISTFLTEVFQSPNPDRDGRSITVAESLDTAAKKLQTDLADQPARRASLQITLAKTYYSLGLYQDAIQLQEPARDYYVSAVGKDRPETLMAMHDLGTSYVFAGRRKEALQMQEEVLKLRRKVLGPEHPDTIQAMHGLAVSYAYADRRDEALQMQEDVLRLCQKVHGPEDEATIKAMSHLAISFLYAGDRDEALELQEEVLKICQSVRGEKHPQTLMAMNNLAIYYVQCNRPDEALPLREEVLKLDREVLGKQHPSTLRAMENLATSYFNMGRRKEALQMREEVLAMQRQVLGQQHPSTMTSADYLATSYFEADRHVEALELQEEVLNFCTDTLGPEHSETHRAMQKLAKFYYDVGRVDQAKVLYKKIAGFKPDSSSAFNALAWPMVFTPNDQGKFPLAEQAIQWAQQACKLAPDDGGLRNTLGVAFYRTQQWQKCIETLQQSNASDFDKPHNWLFIAMAYWNLDQKNEAKQWYDKSLDWQTANLEEAKADSELPFFYAEAAKLMTAKSFEVDSQTESADTNATAPEASTDSNDEVQPEAGTNPPS